jgi:transcriptional regulator with PAS, ATPase and Fis domain
VLLLGETGTGKEIAARRVHTISQRPGPMVAVDCGALPENLVESTLFGHEKGAFTGATEARAGEITRAHQGTLFLDEVGNLPLTTQAKLLRVLETKLVRSVGGRDPHKVDVRFIAATNATLDEATFREDLRFRLAGFVATLPPLRERREDLGLLSCALLAELGIRKARISRSAARLLFHHPFPGNARQLRQALRTAALLHPDAHDVDLDAEAFESLEASSKTRPQAAVESTVALRGEPPPRELLEGALTRARGNVAAAARELKTSARQLYRWLERHHLDPDTFRAR